MEHLLHGVAISKAMWQLPQLSPNTLLPPQRQKTLFGCGGCLKICIFFKPSQHDFYEITKVLFGWYTTQNSTAEPNTLISCIISSESISSLETSISDIFPQPTSWQIFLQRFYLLIALLYFGSPLVFSNCQ
jgi:hypothetical protein